MIRSKLLDRHNARKEKKEVMAPQHREKASQQKSSVSFYPDEEEQQRQGRHLANTHWSNFGGYVATLMMTQRSLQGTALEMSHGRERRERKSKCIVEQ